MFPEPPGRKIHSSLWRDQRSKILIYFYFCQKFEITENLSMVAYSFYISSEIVEFLQLGFHVSQKTNETEGAKYGMVAKGL